MFQFELEDARIVRTSIINFSDKFEEKVKVNISHSLQITENIESEIILYLSFEMMKESEVDEPDKEFYLSVEVGGYYSIQYDDEATMEEMGEQLSKDLFPYLRSAVCTIMGSAGMPPFIIPISFLDYDEDEETQD